MNSMKHYIAIVLLISFLTGMTACKKFLEENPKGTLTDNNFYKTEADAQAAVTSVYDGLNDQWNIYYRGIYLLTELPTDNAECGQGVANSYIFALDQYTYGAVNDRIELLYQSLYKTIANANVAIDKIPAVNFDETRKNKLIAEAKFVRGLLYFNLVRLFGAVPLVVHQVTDISNVNQARDSSAVVYRQIIDDLKYGQEHLNEVNTGSNAGRATSAAATALLSKVYLTRHQYDSAKIQAQKVLALPKGEYDLLDNYFTIFSPGDKFNKELIFAVQNKGNTGTANGFGMALFLPRSTIKLPGGGFVGGNSADVPTLEFYNSFKAGDKRKDRTFFTQYDAGAGLATFQPHWFKFFDSTSVTNLGEGNLVYPVIRYADVLLSYAEAVNELSGPLPEAYEAVNKVRRRAYGLDINTANAAVDISGLSQSRLRDAILDERRWEFGFEDHRWFDLVRTGKLLEVLSAKGYKVQDYHVLFPLPQRELDVNKKLIQNTGYLK
jgi:hypothetical protein